VKSNLLNLNQEINNLTIQRRGSQTQDEIESLNLNQEIHNLAIQIREFQTQDEIESLKPEPNDEQSSNSKKMILNSS
jgi:hypothetical protein